VAPHADGGLYAYFITEEILDAAETPCRSSE
jgi:hypothetical protein